MWASDGLSVARHGNVWHAKLDRPAKLNALDAGVVEALIQTVNEAETQKISALVLSGGGKNFSAGFDLAEIENQTDAELLWRFVRIELLLQSLAHASFATVALAHGRNFGAGVDVFAACRYRVAAPGTTFRLPGLQFGLVLGTGRLISILGADRARYILEDSRIFDARQAYEWGFIHQEVTPENWDTVISERVSAARALPDDARQKLYALSSYSDADRDLAELVRSAAKPGIKTRLTEYKARSAKSAAK